MTSANSNGGGQMKRKQIVGYNYLHFCFSNYLWFIRLYNNYHNNHNYWKYGIYPVIVLFMIVTITNETNLTKVGIVLSWFLTFFDSDNIVLLLTEIMLIIVGYSFLKLHML